MVVWYLWGVAAILGAIGWIANAFKAPATGLSAIPFYVWVIAILILLILLKSTGRRR
jgi:hypothetical protein